MTSNDMFGMDEVFEDKKRRTQTIECISNKGQCYYLSVKDFMDLLSEHKFRGPVLKERLIKNENLCARMKQTHVLQKEFLRQQQVVLN